MRAPAGTAEAIKQVEYFSQLAANDGVDLIVFPEALLGGYQAAVVR